MEWFRITVKTGSSQEEDSFYRIVTKKNKELHKKFRSLKLSHATQDGISVWKCTGSEQKVSMGDEKSSLFHSVAEAVAEIILEIKEKQIVEGLLDKEFDFSGKEELERVVEHCLSLLAKGEESPNDSWKRRHKKLIKPIEKCLLEYSTFNLDGFIMFRQREYASELREIVEYAVDEFLVDRQYEEFVSLLKYFVYFQEPQIPVVHVIHKSGQELLLFDEVMNPLEKKPEDGVIVERLDQKDMEMEDVVVSTLISVCPAKVIIHTREPHMPAINTIIQIFDKRVEICRSCPECQAFFKEKEKI
ncbi:putative sporulation protein YtxC [Paenibacillus sp. IHBB 10380]|uniref:putative sporulation protein YtxC n=1 Tax=Paenibacillus sp. IHBB 10380 TaxID=1566358 RepID=UPI0005CFC1A4|nr:putative sporulation protein YtxC [Paenibacillus sp. IHBB 10380]AJS59659.1 hypothetical protein UB51_15570 [Paenibacillus sp. IHBB 10380]